MPTSKHISNFKIIGFITISIISIIILDNLGKYAISDCHFICLLVCLPVGNIMEKNRVNRFSWNFQDKSGVKHGTVWNIWEMFLLTIRVRGFFLCVSRKYVSETVWIWKKFFRWIIHCMMNLMYLVKIQCTLNYYKYSLLNSITSISIHITDVDHSIKFCFNDWLNIFISSFLTKCICVKSQIYTVDEIYSILNIEQFTYICIKVVSIR